MQYPTPVIVSAVRTAIGQFGGTLKDISASDLGATAIRAAIERANVKPEAVGEVIMGNVLQAGQGQNPARQAAIKADLPVEVPAYTINKVCGSGLKSVALAYQAIRSGEDEIYVVGGMESMSNAPYVVPGMRWGVKMSNAAMTDSMIQDGLWDAFNDYHMGITAENVAEKFALTREEQDQFSAASQNKAEAAIKEGRFAEEIVPVMIPQRKGDPIAFAQDEFPRFGTTPESLAKLRPAFKRDGTVTAGNASGINDGAAALVIMSEEKAKSLGLKPLARIVACASAGLDPAVMGMGPAPTSKRLLDKAGLKLEDIDLFELNEAFASQSLGVARELGVDTERVNVNGGAIALGHPVGASGARILVTLLHALKQRNGRYGLASLCIGGGMGTGVIIERVN